MAGHEGDIKPDHSVAIDLLIEQAGEIQARHQQLARENRDRIMAGLAAQHQVAKKRTEFEALSAAISALGGNLAFGLEHEEWRQ